MARSKQAMPVRREVSSEYISKHDRSLQNRSSSAETNGQITTPTAAVLEKNNGILQVVIAVGGIYGSFLTWGYLQEKLTTTSYGPPSNREVFKFPVFLNTIQSMLGALTGLAYLWTTTPRGKPVPPIIPTRRILGPLLLVALTSSLASPFGYASLAHIDYITYILAKSCKLLPVLLLHVVLFGRRFPLYKYLVVAAVTVGVAVFTLHTGSKKAHKSGGSSPRSGQTAWGLILLAVNLLLDGLTNTTQDHIFASFRPFGGPQMMCANNLMQTAVTASYLVLSPWLVSTGVGEWLGMDLVGSAGELNAALAFLARHPAVWRDVLGFAACGAIGQIFIFYALSTFSSVFLVTVTVTRKMVTMMLSVVAFGHRLSGMQWLGVVLVFGGVGAEAQITRMEKMAKLAAKKEDDNSAKKEL